MPTINPPRLSPRQQQLIAIIEELTAARGFAPSIREVAVKMDVHFSRVQQLARTAEARGAITREPRVARSWRVVKRTGRSNPAR